MAFGYHQRPELTAKSFVEGPDGLRAPGQDSGGWGVAAELVKLSRTFHAMGLTYNIPFGLEDFLSVSLLGGEEPKICFRCWKRFAPVGANRQVYRTGDLVRFSEGQLAKLQ